MKLKLMPGIFFYSHRINGTKSVKASPAETDKRNINYYLEVFGNGRDVNCKFIAPFPHLT